MDSHLVIGRRGREILIVIPLLLLLPLLLFLLFFIFQEKSSSRNESRKMIRNRIKITRRMDYRSPIVELA